MFLRFQRAAVVLAACLTGAAALAAETPRTVISGTVFEDRLALALRTQFVPAAGVTMKLYRDGGDGQPTADDALAGTVKTNADGVYLFRAEPAQRYWVTADSRSLRGGSAWAEQTFGPAGSLCASPDGTTRKLEFEGSCFGGKTALLSDDASSLPTSEHVALVDARERITGADFAFSFEVVTRTADGEKIQGSLRQFLLNAAAVAGPNRMRFVPLEYAPEQRETTYGVPPQWWRIAAATPLPEITDADTIVDGAAYNFVAPGSLLHTHPGAIGQRATYKDGQDSGPGKFILKPDLEIVTTGERGIVCTAACGIRLVALHGSVTTLIGNAEVTLEDVLIGAAPDGVEDETPGVVGIRLDRSTAVARHVMVTAQSSVGIMVAREARLDAEQLDVTRCGTAQSGGGIVLFSSGSSIRGSNVSGNAGVGILLGALDGSAPALGNTIDTTTVSSNQAGVLLGPGSSRNAITRNDIIWNRYGGISVTPFENAPPRENRISANRFDENGLRPIVLALEEEDAAQAGDRRCTRIASRANGGIAPPQLTGVELIREETSARVVVRGTACPDEIVEIYQSHVASEVPTGREGPDQVTTAGSRGSVTPQERTRTIPSVGEFNYLGATHSDSNGAFEVSFPIRVPQPVDREKTVELENDIWAGEVLTVADAADRTFSALVLDIAGNSSEISERRGIDSKIDERQKK